MNNDCDVIAVIYDLIEVEVDRRCETYEIRYLIDGSLGRHEWNDEFMDYPVVKKHLQNPNLQNAHLERTLALILSDHTSVLIQYRS